MLLQLSRYKPKSSKSPATIAAETFSKISFSISLSSSCPSAAGLAVSLSTYIEYTTHTDLVKSFFSFFLFLDGENLFFGGKEIWVGWTEEYIYNFIIIFTSYM